MPKTGVLNAERRAHLEYEMDRADRRKEYMNIFFARPFNFGREKNTGANTVYENQMQQLRVPEAERLLARQKLIEDELAEKRRRQGRE
jgi:hypothetical protein